MQFLGILIAVLATLALGCSSASKPKKDAEHAKHVSGTDEQIFIGDTIEKNYDPNVIIKRAESFFDKEDYSEAVIEYGHFLELHRVHVLAPYAQYRMGESYLRMIKTVDRDPQPIEKAQEAFEKLLKDYPGSKYEAEGKQKILECQELMSQYYLFVAHFYLRRDSYLAAAYRFESIVSKFPDMKAAPEALFYLAKAYKELGADDWVQEKLAMLAERYPGNPYTSPARTMLAGYRSSRPPQTALAMAQIDKTHGLNGSNGLALNGQADAIAAPTISDIQPQVLHLTAPVLTNGSGSALTQTASLAPHNGALVCRLGSWC
jgi:outer membrane protein assembly factor BamD